AEPWFQQMHENKREMFDALMRSALYMSDLVQDLAAVEHLRNGHYLSEIQNVELIGFMKDVAQRAQIGSARKQMQFTVACEELPATWGFDPKRIRQVLDNLIDNAIKFSAPASKIKLEAFPKDDRLVFAVQD